MTFIFNVERRFFLQEPFDDIHASSVRSPVQAGFTVGHRVYSQVVLHQEINDISPPILASPQEAELHLPLCRVVFQTAFAVEERFDEVKPSHSGRALEIQRSASFDKMFRSLPATVCQAGIHQSFAQLGCVFEQNVYERLLHAGQRRIHARCGQTERVGTTVYVRDCIDIRASLEQNLGNVYGILRSLLAIVLHPISANIMQKRRVMQARRTLPNKSRNFSKHSLEFGQITGDDGVHGRFECRSRRTFTSQAFDVFRKPWPAFETVIARDEELSIGQAQFRFFQFQFRQPARARMVLLEALQNRLHHLKVARLYAFEEVLGLFFILLQAGVSRYFFRIHFELSFMVAPGVRPDQAERRFVTFTVLCTIKVGTALSADWMRPLR
jgi:hypothetical protein